MTKSTLVQSYLQQAFFSSPDKTAIVSGQERISYSELYSRSENICQWLLQNDLKVGDRVGLLTDQPCEYIAAYFGVLNAGGIVVGLNTQTSDHALEAVLEDSGISIVLSHNKFLKHGSVIKNAPSVRVFETNIPALWGNEKQAAIQARPQLNTEDICQIIYTSGTTGTPKGIMLRHRNLIANTQSVIEYLELTPHDSVMAVLPFFYSYGNSVMLTHIGVGATLIVNQSFTYPNVILDQMAAEEVTGFSGVPSSFAILLHRSAVRERNFPKLRYLTQAGAPMSPTLATDLSSVFKGVKIFIMYGQTEASSRLSYLDPERLKDKAGSIGKAIPGVILTVCRPDGSAAEPGELGEIVATGENIMAGYWGNSKETAKVIKSGRLWTGDLARIDNDGFIFIESRKSDMIKSGSHRIGPKEIEETILQLPSTHEVAVVGRPDEILGEKIVAFVVLKDGCDVTEREVIGHCRRNLPAFKVPHQITFISDLPKTVSGKIQKIALKNE
ncbi:class I adenylate-forming enzyme family protein [Desulforhopalus sp. IMCC35007]|uniref:class I adenylate-forming enzyme family protein n=1 Tax=Desulforhopalus sp. IMCC35007 TaxID=2569543 RepID=UPI0010ADD262|nr:AMP-binding protein [Desulforhopalus sp. IMCC35007]TKB07434.1 long-chain fatty acid--CoA ligase [Desulforhopalus sp. IMCC35007]